MFGTLVVQLLSDYSGGELIVSHGGKEKVFDFSGMKGCTNFHYAAFYANCQHGLKKVTKGYRLCLIYNLLYTGLGSLPTPIEDSLIVGQLVTAMKQWNDEAFQSKGPRMMAYILEHKYCEASLSFRGLKNIDRVIGDVLVKACQEANFELYPAHVSRTEMWSASCYRKKYTLEELCDESLDATHFVSPQGQPPAHFTEIYLDDGVLVPKESIKLGKPDEEERFEATGNEGATVERWYKWTALILWPLKRRLVNIGCDKMTNKLKVAVMDRTTPLIGDEKKDSLELARDLVSSDGHSSSSALSLLQCLHALGETKLICELLSSKISYYIRGPEFCKQAFTLCDTSVGWEAIHPNLLSMVNSVECFTTCCNLIQDLFSLSLKSSSAEPKSLCKELAMAFVKALSSTGKKYDACNADAGISMLKVLQSLGDAGLVSQFLVFLASTSSQRYSDITMFLHNQLFVQQLLAIGKPWAGRHLGQVL